MANIHIGIGGWDFDPWRGTFYPAGLAKTKQLAASRHAAERDRDQRHLLRHDVAGDLREMGGERARRLQVRAQGVALLHQPQESGRGGGVDRQVLRAGLHRARRQARPDPVAARADQEVRRGRDPRLPDAAADQPRRHRASPRARGPARKLQAAASSSPWRAPPRSRSSSPITRPIPRSPISPPISSMPGCSRRKEAEAGRLCARGARPLGGGGAGLGGRGEPGRARLCQRRARRR